MMTPLAARVHGATVGSDLVFLDVARDAYVCLAGAAEAGRLCDGGAQIEIADRALHDTLEQAGLIGEIAIARHMAPLAARELGRLRAPVAPTDVLGGLTMTWASAAARRYQAPFADLIGWAQHRPWGPHDPMAEPCDRAIAVVTRFQRRWPWAVGRGLCLHRAFLLLTLLRQARCDAAWVFGVRTYPFEAHCWLQIGATVLDDPLTRLTAYTPLMTA
ncbi:lasso peptide biosynthesis B2 protein [Phenylobacterium sp.]|uniref:lasso peptide biosynthesis B2 protein n=1 Tax=Phenylobacterium sp. TaxID=1871053 RepID=UPI0030F4B19A